MDVFCAFVAFLTPSILLTCIIMQVAEKNKRVRGVLQRFFLYPPDDE